jgi:hypothetical protein
VSHWLFVVMFHDIISRGRFTWKVFFKTMHVPLDVFELSMSLYRSLLRARSDHNSNARYLHIIVTPQFSPII